MVNSKRYDPTITRFRKHTQNFVSEKTKKGHLVNEEREPGDVIKEEGVLVKIIKNKKNSNGWEVKVDNQIYYCTYGDNIFYQPDCIETDTYYIPKKECKVQISIDKKSKIYTITRINDPNKSQITMFDNKIELSGKGVASLVIKDEKTEISGKELSVDGDIKIQTSKNNDLPDTISVTDLYKKITILEKKISDDNG